jgi:hypothetical protein
MPLDTHFEVVTPEGVALHLPVAGAVPRALGLKVVAADGAPVGWRASFTRNLLRSVDMLPFGYAVGLVACLADPAARRLGDMVARTLVVHLPDDAEATATPAVAALPPRTPLQPAEQAAIVAFAERAPRLSDARRDELADLAAPLVQARGMQASMRLYAIAAWLLGRRA